MSPAELAIETATLSGLAVAEPALQSLLNDGAFARAWQLREVIKQEGDRSVAVIRAEDNSAYLIKSRQPNLGKRLLALISMPLARHHRNLGFLARHDIPVARSLAFFRWRDQARPQQWCQIQEYIPRAITLEQALMESDDPVTHLALIAETAGQLGRIHQLGRYHGDMKLSNILVQGKDIVLIDIEGARSLRSRRRQQKDLARFLVGLMELKVPQAQLDKAIALYQHESANHSTRFRKAVDRFTEKISRRRQQRYGSALAKSAAVHSSTNSN